MKDTVSHKAPSRKEKAQTGSPQEKPQDAPEPVRTFDLCEPTRTRVLELCQATGMIPDRFLTALVSKSMDDMTREGIIPEPTADPDRPSPPALMMLDRILEREILCYDNLESVTAEMESLRELIQHHPGLKPEVEALSKIIEGEEHFRTLSAALAAL